VHERYRSALNRDVPLAGAGEFAPLAIGPLRVDPPVVLAPMAGVTNAPFRSLCRRFGAGLYVSEMITARALVEGDRKTLRLASFAPDETPRSLQLYGVDPKTVGEAVARLVGEGHVDHVDLNFGCPVRKVTRRGGGAAIPAKPRLLANIVRAAVSHAGRVPVTLKFRIGVDASLVTFLDAGRIGIAALAVGLAVAVLSSVIPYSLESESLRRMPANVFGVLMSLEPAVAALAGFVVLGQHLSARDVVAIALVIAASIGVTRTAAPPIVDA
jgi:multidrug transporter EmrE-like cation transporter